MSPSMGRFWLACALSLCLHGGLGFYLLRLPFQIGGDENGPVAVGAVAYDVPDEPMPLTVLPSPPHSPVQVPAAVVSAALPLANAVTAPVATPQSLGADFAPAAFAARSVAVAPPEPTRPAFFQVPVQGRSVVYVLDRSLSMGGVRLRTVKQELLASLSRLSPTSRFQVVFYNGQAATLRLNGLPGLATATEENKQRAAEEIERLTAEGGTKHLPALRLALALEPDVICFLTDADDLTAALAREVTGLNRRRCVIHTFELTSGNRDPDMPLKVLARQNRGEYRALAVR